MEQAYPSIIYNKDKNLEELDNKIADIFSEAIYAYIIRKRLLKRKRDIAIELKKANNCPIAESTCKI